jgi:hypothetical protein
MSDGQRALRLCLVALAALIGAPVTAGAVATITVVNRDAPGEGFNDPTPETPIGGNQGTTRGAQRLIAFQRAADIWAAQIDSPIEIRVSANFDPLSCDAVSAILGLASPISYFRDFIGAPRPRTWYVGPLADALAGMDLAPDEDDIDATFNSNFGTSCAFPAGWYYGLDANPSFDDTDFVTVVLHELGHGLGFLTLINVENGRRRDNIDDAFMEFLVDARDGRRFIEMTNAQRAAAIKATGQLRWDGAAVVAQSGVLTDGVDNQGRVEVYTPSDARPGSSVSHWSDQVEPLELMVPFFENPIHSPGLALAALKDLGWRLSSDPICPADCDGNGRVSIDELILEVRIALGAAPIDGCAAADLNGDGALGINELVGAVSRALDGCPA